jgi:hypothetical protein
VSLRRSAAVLEAAASTVSSDRGRSRIPPKEGRNMSAKAVVIQGVVRSDGTLELEGKVSLPPGRVNVTLEPLSNEQRAEEFLAFLGQVRALRETHGVKSDAEAAIAAAKKVRDEFDEQVEDLGRLQDECRRRREEAETAAKGGG